jgi:hypothetical protein
LVVHPKDGFGCSSSSICGKQNRRHPGQAYTFDKVEDREFGKILKKIEENIIL